MMQRSLDGFRSSASPDAPFPTPQPHRQSGSVGGSGAGSGRHLVRGVAAALILLVVSVLPAGCGPSEEAGDGSRPGSGQGPALYGTPPAPAATSPVEPARRAMAPAEALAGAGRLLVLQTELFPATLWRSTEDHVELFAGLPASGLGGPTFLSYSSPTGIASLRPGDYLEGADLRENWLLAGFAGAAGWTHWDSPWAVFLQRRPERVILGTNGVEIRYAAAAGHFSMMPLYGYEKPPQQGHEFDPGKGPGAPALRGAKGRDPKLLTWEWPLAVARDPLTRLRYWAGATRRFPVACKDSFSVDRNRDTVVIRQEFEWLEVPDDWGTRPIRLAPVSPTLGLALLPGERFPVEFDRPPFDFGMATPYGPWMGIPDADGYEIRFPVLQYLNAMEDRGTDLPQNAPAVALAARDRLRSVAREKFPDPEGYRHDHGGLTNLCWALMGDQWYARALPWYDPQTRSNAMASLGRYLREEVLVPERFRDREFPPGSGRTWLLLEGPGIGSWGVLGDAGKFSANLLETVWAYAHATGDHALVRERWPLLRRLFVTGAQTRWVGFGRDEIAELGDKAAPALAYARLAYLAGDMDAYGYGCSVFARELVHLHVQQRGARWFRERQPWHSLEPIDEEVFLTNLWGDLAGWQIDGPRYPAAAGERQSANRWVRFQDPDVARFYRDHLGPDVRGEFLRLASRPDRNPRWDTTDDSHILPSRVRLESYLLNASPTNLAAIATPDRFQGPPSGIMASCLAVLRSAQPPRVLRLIPGAPPSPFAPGISRDVPGPHPHLVQTLIPGATNGPAWPRVAWWGWQTPTGARWNFGEVRAGVQERPQSVHSEPVSWNTVRYRFD